MKCINCITVDLIEYEGSQGQSLQCNKCKLVFNAEAVKQFYSPSGKSMNIETHELLLQHKWHTGENIEIKLIYTGNENIRIEFKLGDEEKYICVPRFQLQKFMEMINETDMR